MMSEKKRKNGMNDLREKAEEKVLQLTAPEDLSLDEIRRVVHELRVHQIELEMQNDELRETQAELVQSNSKYTDFYDFAPVGYLTLDKNGIIVEANLTFAKQLEVERGILPGLPFPSFISPREKNAFRTHLARIFETREPRALETTLITKQKGNELYALIESVIVVDDKGGEQCRMLITDISGRRKAEEAVKIYIKKLEQSNQELQDFACIASHDLHEPLRKICTFGDQLAKKYSDLLGDEGRDYLDRMIKSSNRMKDMIEGLLNYSRVETRGGPFKEIDLARAIKDVLSDLDLRIKQAEAVVEVGELPSIEGDLSQMRQLFQNFILNSLKFHGEKKPVIRIYNNDARDAPATSPGRPVGEWSHIHVEDNGIGFDEKYLDRIFTLFQRLHGRSAYEGTGMGLAICKRIVERHHGAITAKSVPGKGSTFIVTLPLKQPQKEAS